MVFSFFHPGNRRSRSDCKAAASHAGHIIEEHHDVIGFLGLSKAGDAAYLSLQARRDSSSAVASSLFLKRG